MSLSRTVPTYSGLPSESFVLSSSDFSRLLTPTSLSSGLVCGPGKAMPTGNTTSGFSVWSTAPHTFAVLFSVSNCQSRSLTERRRLRLLNQVAGSPRRSTISSVVAALSLSPQLSQPSRASGPAAQTVDGTCSPLVSSLGSESVRSWSLVGGLAFSTSDGVARIFTGPKSATVPVFAAETAPPLIRGALVMQ